MRNVHRLGGFFLLALLSWPGAAARAQFDITPTDSLVAEFGVDSITRIFQIDFPNTTGDSLGLSWRLIDWGWTETWDVNLCDLGECYTGVPADADMLAMGPAGAGFLKLIVNSLETEGQCFLHFWVWPTGNQDALVHIYFDLKSDPTLSEVREAAALTAPKAYPVPAKIGTTIAVDWPKSHGGDQAVQLFDARGALVDCSVLRTGHQWILETARLTAGVYLFKYDSQQPPLRLIME
jgi:hypothetical protein